MWTQITCNEPYLSTEDIIRLVTVSDETTTAIRIVKV